MARMNWKFLVELLEGRPHTIGAEVGVFEGECALGLLKGLPNLKRLICVDLWDHDEDHYRLMPNKKGRVLSANWDDVVAKFVKNVVVPYGTKVSPLRMPSLEAAKMIKDGVLDFVFVDANHAYEYVASDIDAWSAKVKVGGIISGDDFKNKPNYGVIQAVKERFDNFSVDRRSSVWWTIKEAE